MVAAAGTLRKNNLKIFRTEEIKLDHMKIE
jgi:hypothetical protein